MEKKKDKIKIVKEDFEDFKKLFSSMIAFNEDDRPEIKELLKYKWFSQVDIKKDDEAKIDELKTKVEAAIKMKELNFKESFNKNEFEGQDINESGIELEEKDKIFKENNIEIKTENPAVQFNEYLKIDSHPNIYDFMNLLMKDLVKYIPKPKENSKSLKFNVTYEPDPDEDEDEDDNAVLRKLVIQCKIYKRKDVNNGYILRFKKKEGELTDYYIKLKEIIKKAKLILYKEYQKNLKNKCKNVKNIFV